MFKVSGQSLVGHALGRDDPATALAVVRRLYRFAAFTGTLLGVLLAATSGVLPKVFSGDGDVRHEATTALLFLALLQLPGAVTFVLDGVLMGANDFANLRWQTTVAFIAALPFFVAVRWRPSLGLTAVWSGMLAWMLVRAWRNHRRVSGDAWMRSAESVRTAAPA